MKTVACLGLFLALVCVASLQAADAQDFSGVVGKTDTGPTIDVKKTIYNLKASDTADQATKDTLTKIGSGELKGDYTVNGVASKDDKGTEWIAVNSIKKSSGKHTGEGGGEGGEKKKKEKKKKEGEGH